MFQLSARTEVAVNAAQIFDLLVSFLCVEHIDYALDLGLQGLFFILITQDSISSS